MSSATKEYTTSDLSIITDPDSDEGVISIHHDMTDVKSIHMTLLYDDATVILSDIQARLSSATAVQITDRVPQTLSVIFDEPMTLSANTDILSFWFVSLTPDPRMINVSDTFFLSSDGQRYELTSQGSGPF